MGDYSPLFRPGKAITRVTSAAVTGGQLLAVGAAGVVAATTAANGKWLGVAAFDAASGTNVNVECGGTQRIIASGAVTAGDMLVPAAAGKVSTSATPGAGQQVGIALTNAVDGAAVDVQMAR